MKIAAPLDNKEETQSLIDSGADEFYCGIMPQSWKDRYSKASSMNRREWQQNNFKNYDDLKQAIVVADKNNIPVHATFNAANISAKQFPIVQEEIEKAVSAGVKALIISDTGLLVAIRHMKLDVDIHVSCGAVAINSEAVNLFKDLGAKRIILPRHLTTSEIIDLKSGNPGISFEPFIMNEGCKNIDGYCEFLHGIKDQYDQEIMACTLPYECKIDSKDNDFRKMRTVNRKISDVFKGYKVSCGLCSLYDFSKAGLDSVKIVGRGMPTHKKIEDITQVKRYLDMIASGIIKEEFINKVKEDFKDKNHRQCNAYDCYYPDIMK